VDFPCINEDDVIRFQIIILALNRIVYISAEENDDFIEIMVVEGKILPLPVIDMKHTKIILKITQFFKAVHVQSLPFKFLHLLLLYSIICNIQSIIMVFL
jgi:hypothetical protein